MCPSFRRAGAGLSIAAAAKSGPPIEEPKKPTTHVEVNSEGGKFSGFVTNEPVDPDGYDGAFAEVYRQAGLDPEDYRIVNDTVRFSTWQQSARSANGDRDTVQLFAYRAQFQKITGMDLHTQSVVEDLAQHLKTTPKAPRRSPGLGLGEPCTYTVMFSDWQFGKPAVREQDLAHGATGVEQTSWRIQRAVEASQERIKNLRRIGRNIESVALLHMGDPTEHVANSYDSQTYEIELNLKQQMEVALRHMVWSADELLPLSAEDPHMLFVLCNHGQLARQGTKTNITDDSDNVQNHLAELQRDYIVGPKYPNVQWYIPDQEMITTATFSGVNIAAAHGHKIRGKEETWLLQQTANLSAHRGFRPRLWLTAHRHSQDLLDLGSVHRVQAATADGGSKWFTDSSGIYSTPGTTTLLIGNHDERGFSDLELL